MFNPYSSAKIKSLEKGGKPVQGSFSDFNLGDSNIGSERSFRYDPFGEPLKSTQQLNVDWSKFENHTFFSSGEVKVNESFNRIINGYPFDGTRKEVETFIDSLSGFEKWVWDSFPRNSGAIYLHDGAYISVKDKSGVLYPDLSKNSKGETVINPQDDSTSFSIEFLVNIPDVPNGTQVIFQKISGPTEGFTVCLSPSNNSTVECSYTVSSNSVSDSVSCLLEKNMWNHVCITHNKEDARGNIIQIYVNEKIVSEGRVLKIGKLDTDNSNFLIGSGSIFFKENSLVTPTETFHGTIDELRIFHSVRDVKDQVLFSSRGVYSSPDLKLYYRFNEPQGSLSLDNNPNINSIVLDSSGNSMHANVIGFQPDMRINQSLSLTNPVKNERKEFTIILFPAHAEVIALNIDLLSKAKEYDRSNPNNIIKLIPPHYLLEGAAQDGFSTPEGNGGDQYGGEGIPGQGKMGSVQIILTFLYIWSKYFDEMKMYLDSFGTLRSVDYSKLDTIPDNFLEDRIKESGFFFPKLFTNADLDQFVHGDAVDPYEDDSIPLKEIQAEITRRVLVNLPNISKSKGTQHSIKAFLRAVGIDPNNSLKIREYGGPTTKQLGTSRENRTETFGMVDFYSSSYVATPFLSSSRVELGFPEPAGSFIFNSENKRIGTTEKSDGLLTSGSWSVEGIFKIPPQKISSIEDYYGNQSLLRIAGTGSVSQKSLLYGNLVAEQGSEHPFKSPALKLFLRPGQSSNAPTLIMTLPLDGEGIFDGDTWNISFGCERNDSVDSVVSSSYYLRAGKIDEGNISKMFVTSSMFQEDPTSSGNVFRKITATNNASGSFIAIGKHQEFDEGPTAYHLGNSMIVDSDTSKTTDYVGWVGNLRFFSKAITVDEWKEHVRNPRSTGVSNPKINYNYVTATGSFEKLRLDTLQKQPIKNSDIYGNISFLDFSQNFGSTNGVGFPASTDVILGDMLNYSLLSPKFDEVSCDEKIRIRSFIDQKTVDENPWSVLAPTYLSNEFFMTEEPQDDLRLSIEFSLMDSLSRDMVNMFSSFDIMNDALGSPENMFSPDYPSLEVISDVYFNRLSGKPDWRSFLEFYRWFDMSISSFIEQLVPGKTNYKGTNFVVESHMLERHKNMYMWDKNYTGEMIVVKDDLKVQLITGRINKY